MAKRPLAMEPKLRFLKDQEFEDEAALLLAEYGNKHGVVTVPPVPVARYHSVAATVGLPCAGTVDGAVASDPPHGQA